MKTKLLTLLLCLLTTLPALAFDFQFNGINYNITGNNTAEVTYGSIGRRYSGSITIPAEVQYDGNTYSVTSIRDEAFSYCTGLTSITLPNSLTFIGISAFEGCTALTSITLPNSITYIGEYAFEDCSSLTQIEVDNANKAYCSIDGVLFNKDKTTIITYPAGKSNSNQYIIPNSVTSIGRSAFYGCTSLTSITLPNSIKSISGHAFQGCTGLTSITFPNSLTSIGYQAFEGCTGLTSVTLPNSITSIDDGVFADCSSLTQIEVDNANKAYCSIDGVLFNKDKTTIITYPTGKSNSNQYIIPNSVTSIRDEAFSGCTGLTSITLPNSITYIGYEAFSGCTGLTEIYCEAEELPTCRNDTFYNVDYANCTLYVPTGAVETYRTTDPWSKFSNIVEYDFAGVTEVSSVSPAVVYDLQGRRVSNPRRGIFIINGQKQRLN